MHTMEEILESYRRLIGIMDELRLKCPWDREQTMESLRALTIEETYELAEAIIQKDPEGIKKELGDLLLHIIFYAKIASENGQFDLADVALGISEKLIFRHPHVFGTVQVKDAEEVKENWEHLKIKEGNHHVLSGVPATLPALIKARRLQEKVKGVGFDWKKKEEVWEKVEEELKEVRHESANPGSEKLEEEIGDLFFTLVNTARHYGIDPENALEKTNQKFIRRFAFIESQTLKKGKKLKDMDLAELDALWEEAKKES